jgi:hypothetical protein
VYVTENRMCQCTAHLLLSGDSKQDVLVYCAPLVFRWQWHVFTFLLNINADDWLGRTTEQFGQTMGCCTEHQITWWWGFSWGSQTLQMLSTRQILSSCQVLTAVCWRFMSAGLWRHFVIAWGVCKCLKGGSWCIRNTRNHSHNDKALHPRRQKSLNWFAPFGSDTCTCQI